MNTLLSLLSRDAAGLLLALLSALMLAPVNLWLAALVGIGLALLSLRYLWMRAVVRRRFPAPGRLVDMGGYRIHVQAEGEPLEGRPTVLWFAGGHTAGNAMHHLHRAFRGRTRSILIDRPGTGWSDAGPFPRTTAREADEVLRMLELTGERGPFVIAGHSFGGLLAANIARRRPDLVHTLVLLDPTPLDTILYGPPLEALREFRLAPLKAGLARLFGFDLMKRRAAEQRLIPAYAAVLAAVDRELGPEVVAARAVDERVAADFTQASIYAELTPAGAARAAWSAGVYDGDLDGVPVWLVAPKNDLDVARLPEAQTADARLNERVVRVIARTRERYLATSDRSRRIVAPAGSGHNFVYEIPDFVIGVMREAIEGPAQKY
ncbi:alpha/beta fold hydrolase [Roseateles sp.]|jgi:pimeloyl-ACP methyl ester carboxylesterase|uniref:alpha/beta hydrolase n=1 Tax=Roseateles sp. TaxID=1971397 RepID=UPI0037C64579